MYGTRLVIYFCFLMEFSCNLHICRAYKKINPAIDAIVEEWFTDALNEAKIMDERLNDGKKKGPLYGVPISVK